MSKTVLLTGATDGIGLETARMLRDHPVDLILHGRNAAKLEAVRAEIADLPGSGKVDSVQADLSDMASTARMADEIAGRFDRIDALVNNAGVFRTDAPPTGDGFDIRFAVNTFAPFILAHRLMSRLDADSRVINVSSAAQAPVDLEAMAGKRPLSDNEAYAQSKLAITMWTAELAAALASGGPSIIAVNPASLLGSKMVKDAYGIAGGDIRIGADILVRAALSDEFEKRSGQYYDNDAKRFAPAHPDALDAAKRTALMDEMRRLLATWLD